MRKALVVLFCACAVANAQFTESGLHLSAFEESLDNLADPGLGAASFSEVNDIGEGDTRTAGLVDLNERRFNRPGGRTYNDDSEVITGVTDSYNSDRYESAPRPINMKCIEKNDRYPVPGSCDRYIECLNGTAEEKVCPDGLRYNPNVKFNVYPCQYPSEVPCLERSSLQPPQPTADCPHQFGYFKLGDEKNCSFFRNCVNGVGYDFSCPEGLAFSSDVYRCEWPDQVADCDAEAFLGFKCPEVPTTKELGPPAGYRFYRSATNCQKYFICIDGKPRGLGCGGHSAFDELTSSCVSADEVDACPAELKRAAARSREAETQRLTDAELVNEKLLRSQPLISTGTPPPYQKTKNTATNSRKVQYTTVTVTPEYYDEYVTPTTREPARGKRRY
ncbi:unnamed protein product [Parnassius apollo]|uniref:(apollo) hypothetical protein n=1 Tax=Parnassius apollo TaxID=110799 RepID=A0A8S3XVR6_PARAO|nr:unnamed protein product [Parnassius apollo]